MYQVWGQPELYETCLKKNNNNNKIKNAVLSEKKNGSLDHKFQTLVTKLKPIFINHNNRNNYNQHIFAYKKQMCLSQ